MAELANGEVSTRSVAPEDFGFSRADLSAITVASAAESLALIEEVLAGHDGPARDIVCLNAGAAIYAAGVASTMHEGVERASRATKDGSARKRLDALVARTRSFAQADA